MRMNTYAAKPTQRAVRNPRARLVRRRRRPGLGRTKKLAATLGCTALPPRLPKDRCLVEDHE